MPHALLRPRLEKDGPCVVERDEHAVEWVSRDDDAGRVGGGLAARECSGHTGLECMRPNSPTSH